MREDCKFFQSRTCGTGDARRFCALSLAPEAPWRCPERCPRFEKRIADVGFTLGPTGRRVGGDVGAPAGAAPVAGEGARGGVGAGAPAPSPSSGTAPEPEIGLGVADVLGAASGIVNAAGPEIVAEQERRRRQQEARRPWWEKLRQQSRWRR